LQVAIGMYLWLGYLTCKTDQDRSLRKYARYFARRHPKVIEDENAVEVVVRLEEDTEAKLSGLGRRMTVRTIGSNPQTGTEDGENVSPLYVDQHVSGSKSRSRYIWG
jgi:hypothetical protein